MTVSKRAKKKLAEKGQPLLIPTVALFKGEEILIGHRHYTPDKWKDTHVWTFPGGRPEEGETIGEALKREIFEEVGITDYEIEEFLGEFPGAKEGDLVYLFTCRTVQDPKLMEPEKFVEWSWSKIEDIPENFLNPHVLKKLRSMFGKNKLKLNE